MDPVAYLRGFWRYQQLSRDPIVVGGCERSGTTLLLSVLSAHPSVLAIPYETWGLAWGPRTGFANSHRIRMSRIWRGLGVAQRAPAQDRWAEKSPANVFHFREILSYFDGDVQCLEVVRDGRDVVTSIHPADDEPWVPIERWIEAVDAGLSVAGRRAVTTVRYEDLVRRPIDTLYELCEALDLSAYGTARLSRRRSGPSWLENATVRRSENLVGRTVGRLRTDSVRKWTREGFPHSDRVEELVARPRARAPLREHGYPVT